MSVPVTEQETIIQISRSSDFAAIWTSDTTVMTKIDKLVDLHPDCWRLRDVGHAGGEIVNKEYFALKDLISFRKKKVNREMTDVQRAEAAERLLKHRYNKICDDSAD